MPEETPRVYTIELFFDLVFVLTLTQLTALLVVLVGGIVGEAAIRRRGATRRSSPA